MPDTHAETQPRPELFALTRALVFTKEAYRTLKKRVGKSQPTNRTSERPVDPMIEAARALSAKRGSATPQGPALTPWDMIDEDPGAAGIEFTIFQQRRTLPRRQAA